MPALVLRRAPGSSELPVKVVRKLAEQMLTTLGLEHAELSVLLTDDRTIQRLNRIHRDKDRPTDVLAFPLDPEPGAPQLLGDVVISIDTASRQAASRHRPLLSEVRFLLAHGLLHLLGHDHDIPKRKKAMDAEARRLVRHAELPAAPKRGARAKGDEPLVEKRASASRSRPAHRTNRKK